METKAKMDRITIVRVLDQNAFDKVFVQRAFTDHNLGDAWGREQSESIRNELRARGEDLLDITYDWYMLMLDNDRVSLGYKRHA